MRVLIKNVCDFCGRETENKEFYRVKVKSDSFVNYANFDALMPERRKFDICKKCCYNCFVPCDVLPIGYHKLDEFREQRHEDCPLIEVPTPHGRLIDADEFIKERDLGYECKDCKFDYECNCDFSFTRMDICSWIEDAPTVIESEE